MGLLSDAEAASRPSLEATQGARIRALPPARLLAVLDVAGLTELLALVVVTTSMAAEPWRVGFHGDLHGDGSNAARTAIDALIARLTAAAKSHQ